MPLATKNGSIIVKDGLLAENCGCCSCKCGNTLAGYAGQATYGGFPGRWCCSGDRPSEITVEYAATATVSSWASYQYLSGGFFGFYFYDDVRGYYRKRYKRTLTLNIQTLNISYVLKATSLFWVNGPSNHTLCAYGFGLFAFPRIFPGYEPGSVVNGFQTFSYYDVESFPSYTMTFQTGNSTIPGNQQTTGTIRREYEYRPYRLSFNGFGVFEPTGDWTRDATLDTESSAIDCSYLWAFTDRSVLSEQACDLRPRNLSWSGVITVSPDVGLPNNGSESVRIADGSEAIGGGSMIPQFSFTARILSA